MDRELEQMYRLLAQGYTDRELIKELKMSERTYYWYKQKLYEHYANLHRQKTEDIISYHQQLLHDRLSGIYNMALQKLTEDRNKMSGTEISALMQTMEEIGINIFKLEAEGLRATNRNLNKVIRKNEVSRFLANLDDVNDPCGHLRLRLLKEEEEDDDKSSQPSEGIQKDKQEDNK